MNNDSSNILYFEKKDVLVSKKNQRVELQYQGSEVTVLARGILRYNQRTKKWYVQQPATGDIVATFFDYCVTKVDLVTNIIIVRDYS